MTISKHQASEIELIMRRAAMIAAHVRDGRHYEAVLHAKMIERASGDLIGLSARMDPQSAAAIAHTMKQLTPELSPLQEAVKYQIDERLDRNELMDYIEDVLGLEVGSSDFSELRGCIWDAIKDKPEALAGFVDLHGVEVELDDDNEPGPRAAVTTGATL